MSGAIERVAVEGRGRLAEAARDLLLRVGLRADQRPANTALARETALLYLGRPDLSSVRVRALPAAGRVIMLMSGQFTRRVTADPEATTAYLDHQIMAYRRLVDRYGRANVLCLRAGRMYELTAPLRDQGMSTPLVHMWARCISEGRPVPLLASLRTLAETHVHWHSVEMAAAAMVALALDDRFQANEHTACADSMYHVPSVQASYATVLTRLAESFGAELKTTKVPGSIYPSSTVVPYTSPDCEWLYQCSPGVRDTAHACWRTRPGSMDRLYAELTAHVALYPRQLPIKSPTTPE